jgi:hypothetical protein
MEARPFSEDAPSPTDSTVCEDARSCNFQVPSREHDATKEPVGCTEMPVTAPVCDEKRTFSPYLQVHAASACGEEAQVRE